MVASPSSYVEALALGDANTAKVSPGAIAAATNVAPLPLVRPPTTDGQLATSPRARRGLLFAIAAAMVVAIGGAVVAIAMVSRTPAATTASVSPPHPSADAAVAASPADAAVVAAADPDAATSAPADAAPPDAAALGVAQVPAPQPPTSSATHRVPPSSAVTQHLAAARAAAAANDRLAELAHAQAALKLDPGNVAATYLMGDALVATGDTDHGCQILGNIKRFPAAAQRMRVAGCTN
jgi:hypothetical protein